MRTLAVKAFERWLDAFPCTDEERVQHLLRFKQLLDAPQG